MGGDINEASDTEHLIRQPKRKFKVTKTRGSLFALSLILFLCSLAFLAGGFGAILGGFMQQYLQLSEDSKTYDIWQKTPFPLILKIYIWNITNHEDFIEGSRPELQECGPYVWREYHEKMNISFHDNDTMTYMQQRWWIWDEELSGNNSRDDVVYSLNPIPISAAWGVHNHPYIISILNQMFNGVKEQLVVRTTVDEVIFTGMEDKMLDWIQKNVVNKEGKYHFLLPYMPASLANVDRFGWFYRRNMSTDFDGVFSIMSGTDDFHRVGKIDMWDYARETPFFDAPCNKVIGSAGEFFEAGLTRDKLVFYSSDLCMSVSMYYQKDVTISGVNAYRFWGSNRTFANGSQIPGNECYCVKGTCAPMGLMNAESCRMGAPAFVSFPHYLNADPFLLDQVGGLSPEEDKHAFAMDIMPETGVPVNVNARMQINMRVKPYPGEGIIKEGKIDIMKDLPDIYLPMLWFEVYGGVPANMTGPLKMLQFIVSTPTITILLAVSLVVGLLIMAISIYFSFDLKAEDDQPYLEEDESRYPSSLFGSNSMERE